MAAKIYWHLLTLLHTNMISNHCGAEVTLIRGLVQFVLPSITCKSLPPSNIPST